MGGRLLQVPVDTIETPHIDWLAIGPPVALFASALAIVLMASLLRGRSLHHDLDGWAVPAAVIGSGGFWLGRWWTVRFDGVYDVAGAVLLAVGFAAVLIALAAALARRRTFEAAVVIGTAGTITAAALCVVQWNVVRTTGPFQAIAGSVAVDGFAVFVMVVVLGATLLGLLLGASWVRREGLEGPEFLALLLLGATGMLVMASANDLIVVFVALEVFSIALYVLAAFDRHRLESQEAGLKYFLLGAFSSAVFLYGVALTYGATGTTNLTAIARSIAGSGLGDDALLLVGFALLLVGLGFKVAAAPFHMWTPDVYQGAPTPVTAFMAGATKAAAFGAFLRIFPGSFGLLRSDWRPAVWALAVASMAVGAIAALVQTDVKRMLAYSSIAHAGYVLIAVQVANETSAGDGFGGTAAALFYLAIYMVMAIGAFGVVQIFGRRGDRAHSLDDYRGLARREPALAGLLALFLLAQAGVPLTAGFVAKLAVFKAAVDAGQFQLALVGMLSATVAAFVYLRIVLAMYGRDDGDAEEAGAEEAGVVAPRLAVDLPSGLALFLAGSAVLVLGIVPGWLLDVAEHATQLLAGP
jgi:NADH-quinone oxidoreductase subunit N